jgi:hypothetical protein
LSSFPRIARAIRAKHFIGAWVALLALAVQVGTSSAGHAEQPSVQPAASPFELMPTEFVDAGSLAVASLAATADSSPPACGTCAAATMGDMTLFAIPPLFLLPQAVELLHRTTGAEFVRLRSPPARHSS